MSPDDSAVTIRCPCGTYVRVTQIYANQAVAIVTSWLTKHSACAIQGETL